MDRRSDFEFALGKEDPLFAVAAPGRRYHQLARTVRATLVWPNGYRVGDWWPRSLEDFGSGRWIGSSAALPTTGSRCSATWPRRWHFWPSGSISSPVFVLAGGVVIAGFMSSGLLEYVVHRWVLHGPPSVLRRGHAQHHRAPKALISTPLFAIMAAALAIWGLLGLVLPAGVAALLVFGLYAGYNYFAVLHHWQHHRGNDLAGVAYLRRLERLHQLHHHRQVVNFGISTTIWDRVFGTFQPTREPAKDYVFWSTIRSYWMKLTCKPSATS